MTNLTEEVVTRCLVGVKCSAARVVTTYSRSFDSEQAAKDYCDELCESSHGIDGELAFFNLVRTKVKGVRAVISFERDFPTMDRAKAWIAKREHDPPSSR